MAFVVDALVEILSEIMLFCGPLWVAVLVGLLVGWAWRPKWVADVMGSGEQKRGMVVQGRGSVVLGFLSLVSLKAQLPSCIASLISEGKRSEEGSNNPTVERCTTNLSSLNLPTRELETVDVKLCVTTEDLEQLCQLVEEKAGGPEWLPVLDRSLPTLRYQSWRRDQTSPPIYRCRTVLEDATPEIVRDFFWDDEFRIESKWDDMLLYHEILEECPSTGTIIVHWVKKFPLFCSDREYIIGRRIWESGKSYYCVTKGVPYPPLPRSNRPRRVDLYYSSWCIRAVESRSGDGQLTACEVILFHYEDMGIPWEIAKLGVRQGMWNTVKRIEPALRAYRMARASGGALSRFAVLARMKRLESNNDPPLDVEAVQEDNKSFQKRNNVPKFLIIGAALVLVYSVDRSLLTKAMIFGVAKRFVNARK